MLQKCFKDDCIFDEARSDVLMGGLNSDFSTPLKMLYLGAILRIKLFPNSNSSRLSNHDECNFERTQEPVHE